MASRCPAWPTLLGLAVVAGGLAASNPVVAAEQPAGRRIARSPVRYQSAIQHPLSVRAVALDPLVRGGVVRVRVTTTSRNALERGEVRLTSTGGATLVSAQRATFGRLSPGAAAATEFAVRLPEQGRRFLLQFRVTGDGPSGLEARGATLNLLPDGPADPGRVVTSSSGARVVEYRARRIDR
jgi:hypothetical protein